MKSIELYRVEEKYKEVQALFTRLAQESPGLLEEARNSWTEMSFTLLSIIMNVHETGADAVVLKIYPDWVYASFAFEIYVNDKLDLTGGILLHGYQITGRHEKSPKWSVHT